MKIRTIFSILNAGLFYSCLLFSFAQSADAEASDSFGLKSFDLPGQPLETGLIEFGLQSGASVLVDHDLVVKFTSKPVFGKYEVKNALTLLIGDAPLQYNFDSKLQTFIISEKKESQKFNHNSPDVEEVVVTGMLALPFRYSTINNTQFRGNSAFYDPSRFTNTISRELIADQQPRDIGDVLKLASGVSPGDGFADTNDDLFIRGFQRHAIYVDSFRLSDTNGMKLMPAMIDRIEILKGPSTLMFGQAEPGGIVNVVRKKPEAKTFTQVSLGGGNFGMQEADLDFNSQAFDNNFLSYRLIASHQSQDFAQDANNLKKDALLLETKIQVSPEVDVEFSYQLQNSSLELSRNFLVFKEGQDVSPGLTLDQMVRHLRPDFESKFQLFSGEINYYINNAWHINASYFWQNENRNGVRTSALEMQKTDLLYKRGELGLNDLLLYFGGEVSLPILIYPGMTEYKYGIGHIRNLYDEQAFETVNNLNISLDGNFELYSYEHKLIVGFQYMKNDLLTEYFVEDRLPFGNQVWPESVFIDLLPSLSSVAFSPDRNLGTIIKKPYWLVSNDIGIFAKDSVNLTEALSFNLGVRITETRSNLTNYFENKYFELKPYNKVSTQLGFVYQLNDHYSVFSNYSEAMRANYHLDDLGTRATEPELSYQQELGVKLDQFSGRFEMSAAIFHIHKINIADTEVANNGRVDTGFHEVDVQGFELDATTQLSQKISLMASGSFINPKIQFGSKDGNTPALATKKLMSAIVHYQALEDVGLSLSATHIGDRFGDDANEFMIPRYTVFDFNLHSSFQWDAYKANLDFSIKNLADLKYETALISHVRENFAIGRTAVLKLSLKL